MKNLRFVRFDYNKDSRLEFWYQEESNDETRCYQTHEPIPSEIAQQGEKAILRYVQTKIDQLHTKIKRNQTIEDNIKKNNIPVKTISHDGTPLEGRIIEATNRYIKVELDQPLHGYSAINYGFASAMAGQYVFDENHHISQSGIEGAETALRWAYRDALSTDLDLVNLVNTLNKLIKQKKFSQLLKQKSNKKKTKKKRE